MTPRAATAAILSLILVGCEARRPETVEIRVPAALPASADTDPPPPPRPERPGPIPRLYDVSPGMTLEELRARLGDENWTKDREETLSWWGVPPERLLPVHLAFDHTVSFNNGDVSDHTRPVWYAYLREGRAVQFKVTMFSDAAPELKSRFGFPPSCFVGAPAAEIGRSLGPASVVVRDPPRHVIHYYLRRGIAVMEEDGHVDVFDIFTPFPADRVPEVVRGLSGGSK